MKKILFLGIAILPLIGFGQKKTINTNHDISMFPQAETDYKKAVINVPPMKNETDLKLEINIGKHQKVDCNNYFFIGKIKEETLNGWGYTYYKAETDGKMGGTLMGCLDGKKVMKFISLGTKITEYNSNSPYVIYVPKDFKVKYRILTPNKEKEANYITK